MTLIVNRSWSAHRGAVKWAVFQRLAALLPPGSGPYFQSGAVIFTRLLPPSKHTDTVVFLSSFFFFFFFPQIFTQVNNRVHKQITNLFLNIGIFHFLYGFTICFSITADS